ncbi:MAG: hypothetical protein HUJ31_03275, partial [Pseudomonadales bacterium]|nr:hypothetical protein [Pseudomonadales bacterium]
VQASIDGTGGDESGDVIATGGGTIDVLASDLSTIRANLAAVSVGAAVGGNNAAAVSLGVSVALNEVDNDVAAFIEDAPTVSGGAINVKAEDLEDTSLFSADYDDTEASPVNLEVGDRVRDTSTGDVYVFLGESYRFTDAHGVVDVDDDPDDDDSEDEEDDDLLRQGDIVRVGDKFYEYTGANNGATGIDLSDPTTYTSGLWTEKSQSLGSEDFDDEDRWNRLATIDAQAVAVSVAAAVSGKTAVGVSGAGAGANNRVRTNTNAYVERSDVISTSDVTLDAKNTSSIDAAIVAASAGLAGGSKAGVGASVGAAVAFNEISGDGTDGAAQVRAFTRDSSVNATGDFTLDAASEQTINAIVVAGSAAISLSSGNSLGLSGAGVSVNNLIKTDVHAFIEGDDNSDSDSDTGISANAIDIDASDDSTIDAVAVGASLAAAFSGSNAGALSIGVSLATNEIENDVAAYILDADSVAATGSSSSSNTQAALPGDIDVTADVSATISAASVAASAAIAVASSSAIALSGAGANATNVILTDANAHVTNSTGDPGPDVDLAAINVS